ncbi:coniferyl aldehyde dehydrogenase [Ruegeria sp.]|uniref:coniferyl aldehyde dehydrogenase n=1 Tax=Ruegeria sp. TaxID=1879320 RepID=UPI003B5CFA22
MNDMTQTDIGLTGTLAAMRKAHSEAPEVSLATRKDRLNRLEQALLEWEPKLIEAISADFSYRNPAESANFDITLPIGAIRHTRRNLRKWMKPQKVHVPMHMMPAKGRIYPQPLGVIGVISPWNFPVNLAIIPSAEALAAGNRVMLKPSELTPRTSEVLAEMVASTFDPLEFTVINGGLDVAAEFSALPFDHLLFTGSTNVGRIVAETAARNLTPVTLELGGKSPVILGEHGDIARAAERVVFGKCSNAGQICLAPDYALVPRAKMAEFVAKVKETIDSFYPDFGASSDYGALIDDRHLNRLQAMVEEARAQGAEVIQGSGSAQNGERKMSPTIIVDPSLDSAVMQEEIFGPILPVIPYDSVEQAQQLVNSRARPLALYVFSNSKAEWQSWLSVTTSGGACVNETLFHAAMDTLPFGGVGPSGSGAYHGKKGFETFSHMKSVMIQPKLNGMFLFNPPKTKLKRLVGHTFRKLV